MTQAVRNAPTRVSKPSKIIMPPRSSEIAAAPSHNHAGFMKARGGGIEVHFSKPGPPKLPSDFCAPCAIKTAPIASRRGTVVHVGDVEISLLNIVRDPFKAESWESVPDINGKSAESKAPGRKSVQGKAHKGEPRFALGSL